MTAGGTPVVVQRQRGSITVDVENPSPRLVLVFKLRGAPGKSQDEEREVIDRQSLFLLWSDRFYPIDFNDWATVRTRILLPPGFQAIAPGRLVREQNVGKRIEYTFETPGPEVNYSVFADAGWIKTERKINGLQMQTLLYPESQRFAQQVFATSSEVLKFFSRTYCPYPFAQFSFVTIKGMYARRAFSGFVGYEPRYLEKEFATTGHDVHETSLLWWGYTIRGSGSGSSQWLEGFGDYAEILYDEAYHKPIPKIFEFFRTRYLALPSEKDLLCNKLRGNTDQALSHGKYPWLMQLVRYVAGDAKFKRSMNLLFKKHKFQAISMDEFISTLEEGNGRSLKWFRDEWLNRRGVPRISFKSNVREEGGAYNLTCTLEQLTEVYHLPVEIGIETTEGTSVKRVFLSKKEETFSFESKAKPKRILLDPNNWTIMNKIYQIKESTISFLRIERPLRTFTGAAHARSTLS